MNTERSKRQKNFTFHTLHIGDWVQEWNPMDECYMPPTEVVGIFADGTVYHKGAENIEEALRTNIGYIDYLPITRDGLAGFGFEFKPQDQYGCYLSCDFVFYNGKYIGQFNIDKFEKVIFYCCGCRVKFFHELIPLLQTYNIYIKLKLKGDNNG